MNVDPRLFDQFQDWAEATVLPLSRLITVPLPRGEEWQDWGMAVIQDPKISQYKPPIPLGFNSWTDWALQFNQVVPL